MIVLTKKRKPALLVISRRDCPLAFSTSEQLGAVFEEAKEVPVRLEWSLELLQECVGAMLVLTRNVRFGMLVAFLLKNSKYIFLVQLRNSNLRSIS